MRKTSQDGTDSTSVTSGLDNDLKRPGPSTNKIKKTSIKRKVPNYSHDSDDAIIEPLLPSEKEHSVVANRSAKYLLNKPKTDCLLEKDTKPIENPRVSTPVSIPNNVTNNIISENQTSPSFISEPAPIYNHLNVNVLSGFDLKKLNIPTGNSIILEIDGCKTVCHGPSPLIFTTAKIHADTKTKVMDLFQVTPMPILSTNEGDEVKSGMHEDDKKHNILHSNKHDVSKNVGIKPDLKLEPTSFNEVLIKETLSNSIQTKNQDNKKNEIDAQDPFEKPAKIFSKDQKVSLKTSNANSVDPKSQICKVTTETMKAKPTIATSTYTPNGGFISDSGAVTKTVTSDKHIVKANGLRDNEKSDLNQISQPSASSSSIKQNNKSNINTTQNDKIDSTKSFSTSSKKLQRQKNASIEEIKEINNKGLNNITTAKTVATLEKPASNPPDNKSDSTTLHKSSTPITTVATKSSTPIVTSGIPSKNLTSSPINPSTCKSIVTTGTSAPINVKSVTETVKTKPAPTRIPEPTIKSTIKSPATVILTTTTSSKTSTTSTTKSSKVTDDRSTAKPDVRSVSVLPSKTTKTEQTTTSSVASALPLYIVSTSKTKIGSPSTPSISTVTRKTLDQKPATEVVTTDGKSGKPLMSTSASQSNQSSSKPKITNINLVKKDDRA